MKATTAARLLLPLGAALALAACGSDADDTTMTTDTVDESGGELQVTQPDPDAVPVDLPETEMTNAPAEEATPAAETPAE